VSLLGGLIEPVQHSGLDPLRCIGCDPERLRDAIGRHEADAADIARQSIRVLAHDGDRLRPVPFVDSSGVRRAHAVGLQEDHDVADAALLAPCRLNGGDAHAAEPGNFMQPAGFLLDDAQRVELEARHELARHDRPDAAYQPGSQELLDADERRGRDRQEGLDAELASVAAIFHPAPLQSKRLPGLDPRQIADHGHRLRAAGVESRHGPAGLGAHIDDVLEHSLEGRRPVLGYEERRFKGDVSSAGGAFAGRWARAGTPPHP